MPSINRIRICNVYYNDRKDFFDDLILNAFGDDMLTEMFNGGGKSLILQCIAQTVLPNSMIQEEWEFKKLFSKTNNNNNIHIMVEWNLDEGMEHKYMIAGFCAYRDDSRNDESNDDEKGDRIKSPLYYNYICMYDELNQYDIAGFPLVQRDTENRIVSRMSHSDLRKFLRNIKTDKYYTEIFDSTRDCHQRLSQYYINPVEWDILREVNADEKFVAKVFREKKTAKDFLLKFLVPKVEKCYSNQISTDYQDNEALADSLLNLRTQLDELIQKKEQISEYDYFISLVQRLVQSLENIRLSQEKKEQLHVKIGSHVNYLVNMQRELELQKKSLSQEHQSLQNEKKRLSMCKDSLELFNKSLELQGLKKIESEALKVKTELEGKIESELAVIRRMKAENAYYQYITAKSKIDEEKHKLEDVEKSNTELTSKRRFIGGKIKRYIERKIDEYDILVESEKKSQSKILESIKAVEKNVINYSSNVKACVRTIEEKENQANKIQDTIISGKFEDIAGFAKSEDTIEKLVLEADEVKNAINSNEKTQDEIKDSLKNLEMHLKISNNELSQKQSDLNTLNREYEKVHQETKDIKEQCEKYEKVSFIELKSYLFDEHNRTNLRIAELGKEIDRIEKYIESLLNNSIRVNSDTYEVLEILKTKFNSADLGMDFIESCPTEEKKYFLDKNSLLPYSILLNDKDFSAVKMDAGILKDYNGGAIPIINMDKIHDVDMFKSNTIFTIRDTDFFVNEDRIKEERKRQENLLSDKQYEQDELKDACKGVLEEYETVQQFLSRYSENSDEGLCLEIVCMKEEVENLTSHCNLIKRQIEETKHKEVALNDEMRGLNDALAIKNHSLNLLREYLELYHEEKDLREAVRNLVKEKESNEKLLEVENKNLEELRVENGNIDKRIRETLTNKGRTELEFESYALFDANTDGNILSDKEYQDLLPEYKSVNTLLGGLKTTIADIEERIGGYCNNCETAESNVKIEKHTLNDFGYINLFGFTQHSSDSINNVDNNTEKYKKELKVANVDFVEKEDRRKKLQWRIDDDEKSFIGSYATPSEVVANQIISENDSIDINIVINEYITLLQENGASIESMESQMDKTKELLEKISDEFFEFKSLVDSEHINMQKITETKAAEETSSHMRSELQIITNNIERFQREYNKIIRDSEEKVESTHIYAFRIAIEEIKNIPQNSYELQDRIDRLAGNGNTEQSSMLDMLSIQKEQIAEDIKNLEKQERNFVDLCIQKCTNIYRDLKKLQSISRIDFLGRKQDILEINIKRLSDEECIEKMRNYIEQLIDKGREAASDKDRRTLIVNGLATERLLPQILEGLRYDSVKVYKIEDVYNDSKNRFLNWQEAVGSKGQTNSMYICVLICVMTFLRRLQTANANNSKIFLMLDNPFAGTSTEDLWVGILELIKQNNIQFLSVGHEVKGQLANCFATRYILEKERKRGIEYTVVIDFVSKYDLRMLEYHPLNGRYMSEQISFGI